MSELRGHFGGVVKSMTLRTAVIQIEKIGPGPWSSKVGDEVVALRKDFMKQPPMPCRGAYIEGNIMHDPQTKHDRFINIVRPV